MTRWTIPWIHLPSAPKSPIAFVGIDRQLHVLQADTGTQRQVTWSRVVGGLAGSSGAATPDGRSWPTWSPDGRWLACFRQAGAPGEAPTEVIAVEVDGVEERVLLELDGEVPIYAQWSSDGSSLAVLSQADEELQLWICTLDGATPRVVEHGVPLFFSWVPQKDAMVVHSGGGAGRSGRIMLRAVGPEGEDVVFPTGPGTFCAPLMVAGDPPRVAFVSAAPGERSHVITANVDGGRPRHVATLRGLLAVVPDKEGRQLAIGSAMEGESTPYDGVWLGDAEGGPLHQVSTHPCMAFFWCRGGRRLVYASLDREAGCARWTRMDLGSPDPSDSVEVELTPFWPTRDQLFLLHFFEQYAPSHAMVDPTGRWLVYASHPDPASDDPDTRPRILLIDLDQPDPEPQPIAFGRFAAFAPERTG